MLSWLSRLSWLSTLSELSKLSRLSRKLIKFIEPSKLIPKNSDGHWIFNRPIRKFFDEKLMEQLS
jgi:hypothetical protein